MIKRILMLKKIIKYLKPNAIQVLMGKYKQYQLKSRIVNYLRSSSEFEESEKKNIINYLTQNQLSYFPYDFTKKYKADDVIVYTDDTNGMKYVLHESKRLYFKKKWDERKIQTYYNSLLIEQDIDSPHRYETVNFCVEVGDVVVDAGAAEGNFALSVVERVRKLYLFEIDEEWGEALEMTFAPWKEKIEIIYKYVSDNDIGDCITLDSFLRGEKINFIKADIEGAEIALLKGSKNILSNTEKLKMVLCTYHNPNDAEKIDQILTSDYKYNAEFSNGYMLFLYNTFLLSPPFLRRGVIRAIRLNNSAN